MSNPYGKKEKFVLWWYDGNNSIRYRKGCVEFKGTAKHCVRENIRWYYKKGLVDIGDLFELALMLDVQEFGTLVKQVKKHRAKTEQMIERKVSFPNQNRSKS